MARILVTGASGFVGKAIAQHLRSIGHAVVGTVHSRPGHADDVVVDVREMRAFDAVPAGAFDVVVNSAALTGPELFDRRTREVNVDGAMNALAFARARGVSHFVQIGTIAAYGTRCMGQDRVESTPLTRGRWNPTNTEYMRTKAEAERRIAASGVPYTTLRLPVVIGRGSTFAAPAMLPTLARGRAPYVRKNDSLVSVVCVGNVGPAVESVLATGPLNAAFNVCDHHLPWNDLVGRYAHALGRDVGWSKRPITDLLLRASDPHAMFWLTNGLLGAHFPSDAFERAVRWNRPVGLDAAIADEVDATHRPSI